MSTVLTPDDVGHLRTGAHFLACAIDPTAIHVYAGMIQEAMQTRSVELITVDELAPEDLVVSVGMVTQGLFISDMPPVGDEFTGCIEAIETRLGRRVRAIYSLAAANINGIIPLMVGLQSSLPVIDSDPMGRVFPLISQTTLNIGGVAIAPIALMGATGERAVVEAGDPQRAETLVRALVTELGGWAATVMYPCSARQLAEHGVHGSISRMIRIGRILESETSAESKFLSLSELLGVTRIARGRVSHIEGLSRPTDLGLPAQPSSVTLEDETTGQIIRMEIQNEILLVLVDGAVAAAVPDMVTLLNSEHGSVANLDDLRVGNVVDVLKLSAAPQWYSEAGLDLAEPAAFGIPLQHPRRHHG
ncbi:DUF917 domain-containing protein [Paenarthrobacter ureafaciens]|uniref:DUF917 domain-containing protein n=1 Tax=Paenarthrobacter ureafaciens TaxID=37931 RepID=UPI00140CDA85|nr:DUF917 domain-containing protein [Paenarthrobacter ureafaciens]MCX8453528.1 DUF917 domain-containing protein [Paenarthrobacter ureafaciens]MCY0973187.1 DUF917 domain-containing protein [Paenarthrobacter ureafaciens]